MDTDNARISLPAAIAGLYGLCRATGGSSSLIETSLLNAVKGGGIAISGDVGRTARIAAETWRTSGGSKVRFSAGLKDRLARLEGGGRRCLAVLSLLCALQGTPVQAAAEAVPGGPGTSAGTEDITVAASSGTLRNYSGAEVYGKSLGETGADGRTMGVYMGGEASSTMVESGGGQHIYDGGVTKDTVVRGGGVQHVHAGGVAIGTVIGGGGVMRVGGQANAAGPGEEAAASAAPASGSSEGDAASEKKPDTGKRPHAP